ncbi:hypothetical protein [Rhizobium bangladeshense]|uniref:hypothetical protein n=1 Tax=Rhizobium bangladeshense TaxID=1138189 RepID=UPI001C83F54E|nr:hypothetical protein [Rhizobium bangladeshense]MBX4894414.1 hypothetical protein [Rhizobium bangladeshense]MBY3611886.1 hypothetical protein [Rhizobium bangladeshense]
MSRRTSHSTEAEEAQDSEHDDYGADEPDYVIHVKSPSKWNESGCKQIMCGGSSGSNSHHLAHQEAGSKIEPKLDEATVASLKDEWLKQIRKLAKADKALVVHPDLGSLLYRWRDYAGGVDEPRTWVQKAIASDEGFLNLVERLMTTGTSHTAGELVSSRVDSFDRRLLDDLIGEEVARKLLARLDESGASDKQRRAIAALRKTLDENAGF